MVGCRLLRVTLDVATESGDGPRMESVEMCACPRGFAGTSCEVLIRRLMCLFADAAFVVDAFRRTTTV